MLPPADITTSAGKPDIGDSILPSQLDPGDEFSIGGHTHTVLTKEALPNGKYSFSMFNQTTGDTYHDLHYADSELKVGNGWTYEGTSFPHSDVQMPPSPPPVSMSDYDVSEVPQSVSDLPVGSKFALMPSGTVLQVVEKPTTGIWAGHIVVQNIHNGVNVALDKKLQDDPQYAHVYPLASKNAGLPEDPPSAPLPPAPMLVDHGAELLPDAAEHGFDAFKYHKGGGGLKNVKLSSVTPGAVVQDKSGNLWKVKEIGASIVLSNGTVNVKASPHAFVRPTSHADLPGGDHAPSGTPMAQTPHGGVQWTPNDAGAELGSLNLAGASLFKSGGKTWTVEKKITIGGSDFFYSKAEDGTHKTFTPGHVPESYSWAPMPDGSFEPLDVHVETPDTNPEFSPVPLSAVATGAMHDPDASVYHFDPAHFYGKDDSPWKKVGDMQIGEHFHNVKGGFSKVVSVNPDTGYVTAESLASGKLFEMHPMKKRQSLVVKPDAPANATAVIVPSGAYSADVPSQEPNVATPLVHLADSPGRGPSGKLRNFQSMGADKLAGVVKDLEAYGKDPEALAAAQAAHAQKTNVPAVEPPAPLKPSKTPGDPFDGATVEVGDWAYSPNTDRYMHFTKKHGTGQVSADLYNTDGTVYYKDAIVDPKALASSIQWAAAPQAPKAASATQPGDVVTAHPESKHEYVVQEDAPSIGPSVIPSYEHVKLSGAKSAGGSTGATVMQGDDGKKYLLKTYGGDEDRVATELLANALYRAMGAKVAEAGTKTVNGKKALAYPLLDGAPKPINAPSWEIGQHYMTDALAANWDFIGLTDDNILWGPDGKPFRVDQGGTLQYRAMGEKKPFGDVPAEVWTMLDKGQGKGKVLVTKNDAKAQAAQIRDVLTDSKIDKLVNAAPFASTAMRDEVRNALKDRTGWMGDFATGKKDVPAGMDHIWAKPGVAKPKVIQSTVTGKTQVVPPDMPLHVKPSQHSPTPIEPPAYQSPNPTISASLSSGPLAAYKWHKAGGGKSYDLLAKLPVGAHFTDKSGAEYHVVAQTPQGTIYADGAGHQFLAGTEKSYVKASIPAQEARLTAWDASSVARGVTRGFSSAYTFSGRLARVAVGSLTAGLEFHDADGMRFTMEAAERDFAHVVRYDGVSVVCSADTLVEVIDERSARVRG
jgi:hypothetical protein